jgi:hypothetical protein
VTKPLTESFHDWLSGTIDAEGVRLPHALMLHDDDTLTVVALDLTPDQAYAFLLTQWALKRPKELIFGLDRFAKLDQGTTLGDLIAGHHFVQGGASRPFVVEYQHDPRILHPIDWSNAFWNRVLCAELSGSIANLGRPR